MPDHANDNDSGGDVDQDSAIAKHISDNEEARRILGQFDKLMDDEATKH